MKLAFFLFLAFIPMRPSLAAAAGHDQGNGGDLYAAEFVEAGQKVADLLRNNGAQGIDVEKLEKTVATTKVESTEGELKLDGLPKDAINYPSEGRIVFSRKRWRELDAGQKPVLVLHEYLGIMGVEDASYHFSKSILGAFTYDTSYWLDCEMAQGLGELNLGIDESAGMDTILLTVNWAKEKSEAGDVMRPVGEFSKMIRDGNFSLALNDMYLISLRASEKPLTMTGSFAANGRVIPVTCEIKKADLSKL